MIFPFKRFIKKKLSAFVEKICRQQIALYDAAVRDLLSKLETKLSNEIERNAEMHSEKLAGAISLLRLESEQKLQTLDSNIHYDIVMKVDLFEKNLHSAVFDCKMISKNMRNALQENIEYRLVRQQKKDKVVYTCLTGAYDDLPLPEFVHKDYDYVCFTDNEQLLSLGRWGVWQIRPLVFSELDGTRNSRWHKLHPHLLFPEYEESLWIDSNMTIRSAWIFDEVKATEKKLLIPIHFERNCIYQEIEACRKFGKEQEAPLEKIQGFLASEEFPSRYGLNETNLIYRRHNDSALKEIMEEWWSFIRDYTKRDQLSLSYVLWRHGITPAEIAIPNLRSRFKDFLFHPHKGVPAQETALPDYPVEKPVFAYNVDIREISETHSRIVGYAFKEGCECAIYVSCHGRVYKAAHYPRPDVQRGNNLPLDTAGFSLEVDDFLSEFTICLADEMNKKIYAVGYVCPQI